MDTSRVETSGNRKDTNKEYAEKSSGKRNVNMKGHTRKGNLRWNSAGEVRRYRKILRKEEKSRFLRVLRKMRMRKAAR